MNKVHLWFRVNGGEPCGITYESQGFSEELHAAFDPFLPSLKAFAQLPAGLTTLDIPKPDFSDVRLTIHDDKETLLIEHLIPVEDFVGFIYGP